MNFTPEQVQQILRAQAAVVDILKGRFPNQTTQEATKISHEIVRVVVVELAK